MPSVGLRRGHGARKTNEVISVIPGTAGHSVSSEGPNYCASAIRLKAIAAAPWVQLNVAKYVVVNESPQPFRRRWIPSMLVTIDSKGGSELTNRALCALHVVTTHQRFR